MTEIRHNNTLIAILIRTMPKGTTPQTDSGEPLQLVTLRHPKGAYLVAHTYGHIKKQTTKLQQCFIVKKGKIKIDLYGTNKDKFKSVTLNAGDVLLALAGGFGVHMLEDSEVIELKNGPFIEKKIAL